MYPKTILITGITSGIGKAFIKRAEHDFPNCTIVALSLHKPKQKLPSNVELYKVDITNHSKIDHIMKKILKVHSSIDILINNAGNGWRGMVEDTTIEEAKQQMEVNVWAAMRLTQWVLPGMRDNKRGHIVNISSMATTIDYATIGYYSATKAFIEKISKVMAKEVAPWDINVSLIAPGAIKTKFGHNMINIKQYGKGPYKQSYQDWANKFELMFNFPVSSDRVADRIITVIKHPKSYIYITFRDTFYGYLKRILSTHIFDKFIQDKYMKL